MNTRRSGARVPARRHELPGSTRGIRGEWGLLHRSEASVYVGAPRPHGGDGFMQLFSRFRAAKTAAFTTLLATAMVGSLWPGASGAETDDSIAPAASLAASFPTMFADAVGSGSVDPHLGDLTQSGAFPILAGGQEPGTVASISTDAAEGATFAVAGEEYAVGSTDAARAGVTNDNTVIFDRPDGTTFGMRPTGDGGVEVVEELANGQTSTTYRLTIPDGTELIRLVSGDVAVVRAGAAPVAELAAAASDVADAGRTGIDAALDNEADAEAEVSRAEDLEAVAVSNDGPDVVGDEVEDGPTDDEVAEEDGSLPSFLREDAPLEQLESDVAALEDGLPSVALTADEREQVAAAEREVRAAEQADSAQARAEDAAVESAETAELNTLLDEELNVGARDDAIGQMSAELDIGTASAEAERTAAALVSAQREIGIDDRVEAIFSAPLTKTASGAPIITNLEVTAPDEVTLQVPEGLDEAVVVDPFFAFAAVFVVRIVVQRVLPVIVRAAVRYATRAFAQTPTRLAQAAARARQAQAATRAHAQAVRATAYRRWLQARAWAAAQARARAAQIARTQERLRAQAERARRIAQQKLREKRAAARRLAAETRRKAAAARKEINVRKQKAAKRTFETSRKVAEAAAKKAMTLHRDRTQILAATIRKLREYTATQLLRPEARLLLGGGVDKAEEQPPGQGS